MDCVQNPVIKKNLGIRYVKLRFTVAFTEDCTLPKYKTSAIRGGMGEMLLLSDCVRDEYRYAHAKNPDGNPCSGCEFEDDCLVRRILYAKYDINPAFVPKGESAGYIFECEDYRRDFYAGSKMRFNLILFGKTIVFLNPIMTALYMLGNTGLGRDHAKYEIEEVRNQYGDFVMRDRQIYKQNYRTETVLDYVNYRLKSPMSNKITVRTPMTLKYFEKELTSFQAEAFLRAACRRIYMLDCYEGINTDSMRPSLAAPSIVEQHSIPVEVPRFSGTHGRRIYLRGIRGNITWAGMDVDTYAVLLAGELLHIGKNVTFGFGKYEFQRKQEN